VTLRARAILLIAPAAAAVFAGGLLRREKQLAPHLSLDSDKLLADGYDTAVLSIESTSTQRPQVWIEDPRSATADDPSGGDGSWSLKIRAGVMPGPIRVDVRFPGHAASAATLTSTLDTRDTFADGTPDFLRLDDVADQRAFRRWFTFLAEAQYFQSPAARPLEIKDCAALIRYAYREALRTHDGGWVDTAALPLAPALDTVVKYRYPYTPLGPALFRVTAGPFGEADLVNGAFQQFADAKTIRRFNTFSIGRDLTRARPGDLLFFRQDRDHPTYHSMIYLGESQIRSDTHRYVIYHTGPDGNDPGELRRLTVEELANFPRSEWRPIPSNPSFFGVSRWNILRKAAE
jgi:uncharacterized protein YfaT (DUF1175 family)